MQAHVVIGIREEEAAFLNGNVEVALGSMQEDVVGMDAVSGRQGQVVLTKMFVPDLENALLLQWQAVWLVRRRRKNAKIIVNAASGRKGNARNVYRIVPRIPKKLVGVA
mmetsp:Transcript_10560/g.13019  ORF Transcript_10560/g.13019 Transcript_10560/m.13019 type:complete len:109 (-) Transcript_10560:481-807(-)